MVIRSAKDAAYSAAKASDTVADSAKFLYEMCPTFLEEVPQDLANEIDEGLMLRKSELRPAKVYSRIDGNLVEGAKGKEKIEVSMFFAMSYTPQAFGALRTEDPQLHEIIKDWRNDWSKYRSNKMGDIKRAIRNMLKGPRVRGETTAFTKYVADTLDTMVTRGKNAKARGDETVDLDLLSRQIAAFKATK